MKQVLIRRGQIAVEDVPAPSIEPEHVLVEVAYSMISSGTEIGAIAGTGKSLIKRAIEQPDKVMRLIENLPRQGIRTTVANVRSKVDVSLPLGYSCSGIVIEVGEGITDIRPGDRVACAGAGIANHSEVVHVPRNLVVKVPEDCDLKAAASMTLGAIALQGVRRTRPCLGEIVAVVGLGLLGQLMIQLLKAGGCSVIGLDLDPRRVRLAEELGADKALHSMQANISNEVLNFTDGHGVDATIITAASQSNEIVQQAMEITRKKGKVILVGDVGLGLKRSPFYEKELDFLISCSYGPGRYDDSYEKQGIDYPYAYVRWTEKRNMQEYLRLIAEGKIRLDAIIEKEYDISEASQAYEDLQGSDRPLAILLRYPVENEQSKKEKISTKVVLRSKPVSGKVRIAVVGAGNFAKSTHLPNLQRLANFYHIRAIVSATGSNAKNTADQYGADYSTTNYEDVLNDPEIDAVLICTRHHLHAQQVVAALKAGKHVYCEKPLALTKEELESIVSRYGRSLEDLSQESSDVGAVDTRPILTVGFNRRFSPGAIEAKEIIKSRSNPLVVVYRVNAGYIPLDNWVHGKEGGGRIIGEACHMFDFFNYLTGAEVMSIDVSAISPSTEHVSSRDNLVVTLKYVDGSICTLIYTALGTSEVPKEHIEIYCDGKTLVIDDFKEMRVYGCKAKGWRGIQDKGHLQDLKVFGQAAINGDYLPIPMEELVRASEISLLVDRQVML
jgi:predicted dehydrogenase